MTTTIRVAHSPDSDDAFMFYALAEGKLDTGDLIYVHELQDIESLNRRALSAELEVTAVSIPRSALRGKRVGIPGTLTTACLALRLYQPDTVQVVMPFDTIEDAVARGEVDVGLLIHEGQLTFQDQGLHLWEDMGAWWLRETGLPLPIGGNVVRRDLGSVTINQVARDLRASIEYGLAHRRSALDHAKQFNRGIGDERTDTFVGMYVNDWTVDYGPRGRAAVQLLLDRAAEAGIIPRRVEVEFVDGNT